MDDMERREGQRRTRRQPAMTSPEGRVPPYDRVAEEAVLGCCLLDDRTIARARTIIPDPRMFYVQTNGMIFYCACKLKDRGEPVDVVTIAAEMKRRDYFERAGGAAALSNLTDDVPLVSRIDNYAQAVRDSYAVRQMIYTAQQIVADGFSNHDRAEDFLTRARSSVVTAAAENQVVEGVQFADDGIRDAYDAATSTEEPRDMIPAGLGGIRLPRGIVSVLGARPSNGKSVTALNIASNAASLGYRPLIMGLEDTKQRTWTRLLARHANIDANLLQDRKVPDDAHPRLIEAGNVAGSLPIAICDRKGVSANWIRQFAAGHKEQHGLDLLIVDYLQLLSGKGRDLYEIATLEMRELVAAADELGCALLAVSQLKRPGEQREGKPPRLSDLRQTGEIEQVAKLVILLHWWSFYDEQRDPHELRCEVAKNSEGPTGVKTLYADMPTMYVGDGDRHGAPPDSERGTDEY